MPRTATLALTLAFVVTLVLAGPVMRAAATPVADSDALYSTYGRVFPDPHGCIKGTAAASPYAKGNVCAAQFLQYRELISGLRYLDTKFPTFMEVFKVPGMSAGIPTTTIDRQPQELYAVRVTDERVTGTKKKFAFSLSIHGIERAGVEGGTRAIEDLVTWAASEPQRGLLDETLPGTSAVTVGRALAESEIWFFYPNPDGWARGDVTQGRVFYQRYNGNGVDPNRDWPTKGFTFRPYTPASEPEVKAFSDFFLKRKGNWIGTGDLHGMLNASAFTFTMLPAGELDYARNKAVVSVARRIQQDSVPRLAWFKAIQPANGTGVIPDVAQRWGTVWDTIAYTTTGSLGDWMGSTLGLDAYVAIDNEMWMSHLAPNTAFDRDLEQAHIDGNKGLIYAQIEGGFRSSSRTIPLSGRIAYLDHGHRFTNPGSATSPNPYAGLKPQPSITASVTSPTTSGTTEPSLEFDLLGPDAGYYSGGFTVKVTYTNVQGVSPADLITSVYVDRYAVDDEGQRWDTVNSHWNQNQAYLAAGHTVNVNSPLPGRWRVRFDTAPPGSHRIDISFTSELSWPDPGQLPYDVSSVKFFEDLRAYLPAGAQLTRVTADQVLAGYDLSQFDSFVIANDPLPGWDDALGGGGAPQPTQTFSVLAPVPTGGTTSRVDAIYEFDVLPEYNNQAMTVATRWTVPSDYDLYVERRTAAGTWVQVGSSTNGINTGETARVSGMFAGHYRARINNWAGAPQQISGTITFSATPGLLPRQYPITRTVAEADAYYAKLKAFADGGGNLVLTDGAARALPHLGVGTVNDVKPVLVYAPYIGFNDGARPTYGDPLAANVNQPGAAEGPGNRHQTVEPVPLGYAIQDLAGGNDPHSFTWAIARRAWTPAAGRIAGTVSDEVALGELTVGQGRIRFVGGLLPDPEERYDHPFGLASYALTWTGWQLSENLLQWQRPLPDLTVVDITTSPQVIVSGDRVTITATVKNIGTAAAANVPVRFTDNGTQIGTVQTIASLPAGGGGTAAVVWNTTGIQGDRTITVTADPADLIRELNKANNSATRVVTVTANQVQNGDFETTTSGTAPDSWTPSGTTTYPRSPDGNRSVTASPGATWTSAPIAVSAGKTYGVDALVQGGTVSVEQLSAAGTVLSTLSGVTTFQALAGVTQVRVKLLGGTGIATFDNVRLWLK
jgi:hypothetical protein